MSTSAKHMYCVLGVAATFLVCTSQLPATYVNTAAASRFNRHARLPRAAMHAESLASTQANKKPAGGDWNGVSSGFMMVACAVCATTLMTAQPADAKPFNPGKFYRTDKCRDDKGLLHTLSAKMKQQNHLPVFGQFFKDDSKRVELAAKRNGMLFSTLHMDADKAETTKAWLMTGGLLTGLVIANPGNAFPRPGPVE